MGLRQSSRTDKMERKTEAWLHLCFSVVRDKNDSNGKFVFN